MEHNTQSLTFCDCNTSLVFEWYPNSLAQNLSVPYTLMWTFLDDLISRKREHFQTNQNPKRFLFLPVGYFLDFSFGLTSQDCS